MSKRAQVNVVGFTLVTLIIIIVVSISFIWGRDLIEKSTNVNELSRVETRMVELHTAIKEVANERSQRSVSFEIKDGWLFTPNNNTIRFESFAVLPTPQRFNKNRVVAGNYSENGACLNASTSLGRLGYDDPGCLIQKGGAIFELEYIVLNDTISNECFGILLEPKNNVAASKGSHRVLLTFNNTINSASLANCSSISYSVVNIEID